MSNYQVPIFISKLALGLLAPQSGALTISAYDTLSDHLESLSTSVPEILTADRLNGQCSGLYG